MLHLALNDCFELAMLHLGILMMLLHCNGYVEDIHRSLNDHFNDLTVLRIAVFAMYVISMLQLCSGDIELNPGPGCYVMCPNCNVFKFTLEKKLVIAVIGFLKNVEG